MDAIDVLRIAVVLAMSAAIGVFTNYIAVKMLFRPYRAKYIGKFKIPFTPGIMPRRQGALAKAMGRMISESLVRTEDIKKALLSDEISHTVAKGILAFPSIRSSCESLFGEGYDEKREVVLDMLTDRILQGILAMNVGEVIATEASAAVSAFTARNPLLGMFVNESTVASLAAPLAERVTVFIEGDGRVKLREVLDTEIAKMESKPIGEMFGNREQMATLLASVYRRLIGEHADAISSRFHIAEIVEKLVAAMPPQDLEHLILSVMRKELNAVIWLGSVIGFVMGLVTTLINLIPM